MRQQSSRTKKLVKSGLQLRLIAAFLCMGIVAAFFQVVLLNSSLVQLSDEMRTDGEVLLAALPQTFVTNGLLTLGILVPMMLIFGIMVTHRIAGPVRRFEAFLTDVANDEAYGPCEIRRSDEMQELCARMNEAIYHLTARAEAAEEAGRLAPRRAEESSDSLSRVDAAA